LEPIKLLTWVLSPSSYFRHETKNRKEEEKKQRRNRKRKQSKK